MRYKKYLLFIMLIIFLGINKIYALSDNECLYQSSDTSLYYNSNTGKFRIDQRGTKTNVTAPNDPLINKGKDVTDGYRFLYFNGTGITVKAVTGCPEYIVYRRFDGVMFFNSDGIWGFNNRQEANEFLTKSNQINRITAYMATYKDASGNKITEDTYYKKIKNVTVSHGTYGININQTSGCDKEAIFGSKSDPNSISHLVNEILMYPRIIVPALVIVLGSVDFFKAVVAGKEDEMKKAQSAFIKRVVIGVAVFLIPVLVNAIMYLADIAWQGLSYTCH